jgi:hypothetical protein
MPFRTKGYELIEQLRRAKEEEMAAIERLRVYLKSHRIDVGRLRALTKEMVEHCERSTAIWRELHDLAPSDNKETF